MALTILFLLFTLWYYNISYFLLLPIIAHFGYKSIIAQPGFSRGGPGRAILPTLEI